MKTVINKATIENTVSVAAQYVGKEGVSSCIFISGAANTIVISASNYEESIQMKAIPCQMDELDGTLEQIAVDGKKLLSILKAFKSGDVVFEVKGNELNVTQNRSRFKIMIMEDEMNISFTKGADKLEISSELISGFEQIAHAIDANASKHELAGALLSVKKSGIALVGTDTRRLAGVKFANTNEAAPKDYIVPKGAMQSIIKLFKGQNIDAFMDDTKLTIETDKISYTTKLVNGKFPQWERIVPQEVKKQISMSVHETLDLIKQAMVVNDEATIRIGKGELSVTAKDDRNESMTAAVEFDKTVKDVRVSMNLRYLQEFLQAQTESDFQLFFNSASQPFVVRCGAMMEVIMPLVDFGADEEVETEVETEAEAA